jgi:hypothetical protein
MELQSLYGAALLLVLVALVIGVGVLVLDKFSSTTGVTAAAQTALNGSRDAISGLSTNWMPLIVTIVALAIILGLVIGAFAYYKGR